jgi:hypothetical protein
VPPKEQPQTFRKPDKDQTSAEFREHYLSSEANNMAKKATAHDAQLILKLYDLRREAEMRKARNWFTVEFWPQSADDLIKVASAFPSQENAWIRQVGGYWDMAASLVLHGALNEELFLQPGCCGEMFFIFAKVYPFLKEFREKTNNPDAFANIEKVATGSKIARKRLERVLKNVENRRKTLAKSAKKG